VSVWRRPVALWAACLLLIAGIGIGLAAAPRIKAVASPFQLGARIRAAAIGAQSEQVAGDYILLVGDSHVERAFVPTLCNLPVLSLGFGGADAANLLDATSSLAPAARPRAILLSVGTNDVLNAPPPGETGPITFERTAATLVERLRALSPRVVVTDVPAVRPTRAPPPADTAARYTEALRRVCAGGACTLAPLFAGAETGAAQPLAFKQDGVHLTDYTALYRRAEPYLCGT
jgi:lysophospholipase L1-like esterase